MAELYGKDTGCLAGPRRLDAHVRRRATNFLGGYGIVGGHIALAAGAAFALQVPRRRRRVLCFFGEGATPIGGFHEGLTLAAIWKLPIVFVCENNQYSMGTPMERTHPTSRT
jgi:pyruvate dehydrogenase E1 component alpha subunit